MLIVMDLIETCDITDYSTLQIHLANTGTVLWSCFLFSIRSSSEACCLDPNINVIELNKINHDTYLQRRDLADLKGSVIDTLLVPSSSCFNFFFYQVNILLELDLDSIN